MLIEKLIGDLLLRHNCVVVPGFGGFVARTASAKLDVTSGIIFPPKKSLLFNKQLINNDGLLITSLSSEAQIPFSHAASQVETCVSDWNKALHAGERITIEKVGFLFLDQEKNIGFEQDRHFNLLLNAYGLSAVNFISEEDIISSAVKDFTNEEITSFTLAGSSSPVLVEETLQDSQPEVLPPPAEIRKLTTRKILKYAAAVAFLPMAFYAYWIPMKTPFLESGIVSFSDFNPFTQHVEGVYSQKSITFQIDPDLRDTLTFEREVAKLDASVEYFSVEFGDVYFPVHLRENHTENEVVIPTENQDSNTQSIGNKHYIVGCFSSEENANNLVKTLKDAGLDAYIVDVVNGYHRVSCGRASSSEELKTLDSKITHLNVNPWVLVK